MTLTEQARQVVELGKRIKLPCVRESDGSPWGDYVVASTNTAPAIAAAFLRIAEILGPKLLTVIAKASAWKIDGAEVDFTVVEARELLKLLGKDCP